MPRLWGKGLRGSERIILASLRVCGHWAGCRRPRCAGRSCGPSTSTWRTSAGRPWTCTRGTRSATRSPTSTPSASCARKTTGCWPGPFCRRAAGQGPRFRPRRRHAVGQPTRAAGLRPLHRHRPRQRARLGHLRVHRLPHRRQSPLRQSVSAGAGTRLQALTKLELP